MNKTNHPHSHRKGNRRSIANILMSIATASVLVYVGFYFLEFDRDLYTDDAQVQQLLTPVNARVGGYIQNVRFKDFQLVKKGDTLVVIDNADYLVQKQLAEAAVMDAQAGRRITASTISTVENGVSVSDARIGEVRAKLWNAEKNYSRYKVLLQKESVTQQQFDQVKSDFDVLNAQLQTLETSRTGSNLNVREANSKIDANAAAIKRAEAQLKLAELNVKYTVITAPCNGYTGRNAVTEGQLVQAGQQLTNIVDMDNKWITANFKEKQLSNIKLGQQVEIEVDGIPNRKFRGQVQAFASATGSVYSLVPVDNSTGNFVKIQQRIPVRIEFSKHTSPKILAQLRAGMSAVVEVKE